MPTELTNAVITHVSYVDKGANQKKFFLTKSEKAPTFEKQVKILTKADDAEQLVYGVVYEPDTVDSHGDFMTAEAIEKAAHLFMKDYQNIDTQHNFVDGAGEVVESYVAPADMTIGDQTITKGSWVLVTKATDEVWEQIQKGEITGYSMAGVAEKTEVVKESAADKLFGMLKSFFTVEKGEVRDRFNQDKKKREFMDAYWIFDDIFFTEVWSSTPDIERIKNAAIDFADLLQDIANSPDILKALGTIQKGEKITVKKEDLQALLKEELAPLTARIAELEKAEADPASEGEGEGAEDTPEGTEEVAKADNTEELLKSFSAVLKAELAPLQERLETVEKARGLSKQAEGEGEQVQKSQSVWAGLL